MRDQTLHGGELPPDPQTSQHHQGFQWKHWQAQQEVLEASLQQPWARQLLAAEALQWWALGRGWLKTVRASTGIGEGVNKALGCTEGVARPGDATVALAGGVSFAPLRCWAIWASIALIFSMASAYLACMLANSPPIFGTVVSALGASKPSCSQTPRVNVGARSNMSASSSCGSGYVSSGRVSGKSSPNSSPPKPSDNSHSFCPKASSSSSESIVTTPATWEASSMTKNLYPVPPLK